MIFMQDKHSMSYSMIFFLNTSVDIKLNSALHSQPEGSYTCSGVYIQPLEQSSPLLMISTIKMINDNSCCAETPS